MIDKIRLLRQWAFVTLYFLILNALSFLLVADRKDRDFLTSLFFSIQTLTTTGYGGGFHYNFGVKIVACIFMIFGSACWAVLIALFVNLLSEIPKK